MWPCLGIATSCLLPCDESGQQQKKQKRAEKNKLGGALHFLRSPLESCCLGDEVRLWPFRRIDHFQSRRISKRTPKSRQYSRGGGGGGRRWVQPSYFLVAVAAAARLCVQASERNTRCNDWKWQGRAFWTRWPTKPHMGVPPRCQYGKPVPLRLSGLAHSDHLNQLSQAFDMFPICRSVSGFRRYGLPSFLPSDPTPKPIINRETDAAVVADTRLTHCALYGSYRGRSR